MVACILLKQAAKLMDKIHHRLKTAFEEKELPTFEQLLEILKEYSGTTSRIFVLFDALDECENQYFRRILELIRNLNDSGIRVYATTREHYKAQIDRYFQTTPFHLEIEAQDNDVKNYLTQELNLRNTDEPDPEFEKEIVDVIATGVNGM
jgi:KAP family P-loop domain